jgi:exonuclease III
MKIVAWNVAHRAVKKAIRVEMIPALVECFNPQIIVLTEYVESNDADRRDIIRNALIAQKFDTRNIHTTTYKRGHNSVLVATKMHSKKGNPPTDAPPIFQTHAASNYLHISIPGLPLELVGFRMGTDKDYTDEDRRTYWKWLAQNVNEIDSTRVIAIGDFNLDPKDPKKRKEEVCEFKRLFLTDDPPKWMVPKPSGKWSHWGPSHTLEKPSSSRLDHALVSTALTKLTTPVAKYEPDFVDPESNKRHVFCGLKSEDPMSDHAVLVLDVDVAP